ncbi:MAG: right-handed parallel beta-helix repeat-containing protein [Flavobacteriales bacterium]
MLKRNAYHLFLFLPFCFLLSCSLSPSKTIVVSPEDSLLAVLNEMQSGDTLLLHGGTYREGLEVATNGIIIQAFPGEKVVLSGTEEINNWIKVKDNLYKAFCKKEVLQLFHKGKMLMPARWPNIDSMFDKKGWLPLYTKKNTTVFKGHSWPAHYWDNAFCFSNAGQKWVVNIETVKCNSDGLLNMSEPWFNYTSGNYTGDGEGYIIKHLNALDTMNEWHWQNDTVYAMLPEDPSQSGGVEGQTKKIMLSGKELCDVRVKNISVFGGRIEFSDSKDILLDNVDVAYGTPIQSYEYSNGGTYAAVIFNGEAEHCCLFNSVVKGNWGGAVFLAGEGNEVYNCEISDCNWMGNGSAAVTTEGADHVVMNCTLYNSGKFLIGHSRTENITIKYNHLYNGGYLTNDMGLTYAYCTDGDGSEIAYNWVHDNKATNAGVGIYIDMDGHDFLIHHNTVWNCQNGIQTIMDAYDHQLYNNTIWNCGKAINYWGVMGTNMYNQRVYNNLANGIFDAGSDIQFNLCVGESQFVDEAKHDFRLRKDSKAIDYGAFLEGITTYYTGAKPDAGAYEYGMDPVVPGYDSTCVYAD